MFGIDDYVIGTVGGAVVGGLLNNMGGRDANSANAAMAQQQMNFQREMSNTAYRRAVVDMKGAGLNPMLAYSQGGASAPGGSTATMQNTMSGLGDAVSNSAQRVADIQRQRAETARVQADIPRVVADARSANASAAAAELQVAEILPHIGRKAGVDANIREWEERQKEMEMGADLPARRGPDGEVLAPIGPWRRKLYAEAEKSEEERRKVAAEAILEEYKIPGARNKAKSDQTKWGTDFRPYVDDLGKVSGSAADILRSLLPWGRVLSGKGVLPWQK